VVIANKFFFKLKILQNYFSREIFLTGFLTFLLFLYLLIGTGLHGDDYVVINEFREHTFLDFINQSAAIAKTLILNPVSFYGLWWAYPVLGYEYQLVYDLVKVFSSTVSVYLVFKFFSDYLPHDRAFITSLIFVLYPLHDTTLYWYMTLQYVLTPAILLYAHHLIRNNQFKKGFFIAIFGSFLSYASPPYLFGLATIFLFERRFKKAIIFLTPGVLYVAYYFWMKLNYSGIERRIDTNLNILDFLKQLVIQFLSLTESIIGPSFWLKIYYAINSISLISVIIVTILSIFAFIKIDKFSKILKSKRSLYVGLISILLLSFIMFALTGLYSHSAFNLGNRTTVYGSLVVAFMLSALLPANKKSVIFLVLIFLAPVFGLSDHWKSWNIQQQAIIENIKTNKKLSELEPNSTLIVTGNIYNKLGPFSNIEFFSMPWNVDTIFKENVKSENIVALAPYVVFKDGLLVDTKFNKKYYLSNKVYVYDSEKNLVERMAILDIPKLISEQHKEIRHWVQLFNDTWVQHVIIWLSPRLAYLFR
jgi:hypothetical protein